MYNQRYRVYPYREGSRSANNLRDAFKRAGKDCLTLRLNNSDYVGQPADIVLNWGNGRDRNFNGATVYNTPETVYNESINKIHALKNRTDGLCIQYTTQFERAFWWVVDGKSVVVRQTAEGKDGEGAVVVKTVEELLKYSSAPLFTVYFNKTQEYRAHFCMGEIVCVGRRVVPHGTEKFDPEIRTGGNGYILAYGPDRGPVPASLYDVMDDFLDTTQLDYGCVDILYDGHTGRSVICELNTAPELQPWIADKYAEIIIRESENMEYTY